MFFIAFLALFGNGYQYQKGFDFCKKYDYEFKECKFHLDNVKKNPKSKHHKDL